MSTTVSAQILNLKMQTYFIFEALYGLKVSNRLIYANIQILRKLFWKNVFCFLFIENVTLFLELINISMKTNFVHAPSYDYLK